MSKQQVSVFMGGTGANTAADARTNLGALSTAGDTMTGQLNISAGGLLVTGNSNFDSGTFFVDTVNRRIGLGKTTPGYKLDVLGPAGDIASFSGGSAADQIVISAISGIHRIISSATVSGGPYAREFGFQPLSNHERFYISINGGERFAVQNTGNVGIGTTDPTSTLHVVGNANITLGINTSTINATTINAETLLTKNGINVSSAALNAYGQANAAYTQANSAYDQANLAYTQANSAYTAANNSNLKLGGVITGTLNVTQDIIIGGNVYLEGNTTYINVATYSIEDSLIYLASNNFLTDSVDIGIMGSKNTSGTYSHTGLARDATDGKWKLFDGLPEEGHVGNVVNFANTYLATLVANVEANTLTVVNGVSGNVNFDSGTLFIDSVANKVGIGTTSPGYKLDINSATNGLKITTTSASSGSPSIDLVDGSIDVVIAAASGSGLGLIGTYSNSNFSIYTNNSAKLTVTNDGNIGIGTTSTVNRFEVSGSTFNRGTFTATANVYAGIQIRRTGATAATDWEFYIPQGSTDIRLYNTTDRVTFTSAGNVGIGDSTVPYKLDVNGDIGVRGANYLYLGHGSAGTNWTGRLRSLGGQIQINAESFLISDAGYTGTITWLSGSSTGNVGIGTTNPGVKLHVYGTGSALFTNTAYHIFTSSGTTGQGIILGYHSGTGVGGLIAGDAAAGTENNLIVGGYTGSVWQEVMRIKGAGNVGIGTTSPAYKLDVNGASMFRDTLNFGSGGYISWTSGYSDGTTQLYYSPASGSLGFLANNALAMFIKSNQNVGIGTTNPATTLHVDASGGGIVRVSRLGTGAGILQLEADGTDGAISTTNTMRFQTSSVERMRLTSTGLGITEGNNPTQAFNIYRSGSTQAVMAVGNSNTGLNGVYFGVDTAGNAIINQTQALATIFSTSGSPRMYILSGGNVGIGTSSPGYKIEVTSAIGSYWNGSSFTGTPLALSITNSTSGGYDPVLIFQQADSGGTIKNAGAIGLVGTNSWTAGSNGTQVSDMYFLVRNSSGGISERMRIKSDGNVGIGTGSPSAPLHVYSSSSTGIIFKSTSNYATIRADSGTSTGGGSFAAWQNGSQKAIFCVAGAWEGSTSADTGIAAETGQNIRFYTNGSATEKMRITTGGNVGIGYTTPQKKLDVNTGAGVGASFGAPISVGEVAGLHFGYSESVYNNDLYKKAALVFERTDNNGQGGNASGKIHFLLNNNGSTSATSLNDAVMTIDSDASGTVGSVRFGIGTRNPSSTLHVYGNTQIYSGTTGYSPPLIFGSETGLSKKAIFLENYWMVYQGHDNEGHKFRSVNAGGSSTDDMTITGAGLVLINTSTSSGYGSGHRITRSVSEGGFILSVDGGVEYASLFQGVSSSGYSTAAAGQWIGKNSSTSRSINAGGTINASGTDYAEYMEKAGEFIIAKGDICGINSNGKLTNVYSDAIAFVVKSTNPSYVGGDGWGAGFKDDPEGLEAARQKVDRIAFSGQVPVNVIGATPGQYIIPVNYNNVIKGIAVTNPTFEEYQISVGKVVAIEEDGRARIIVKVA